MSHHGGTNTRTGPLTWTAVPILLEFLSPCSGGCSSKCLGWAAPEAPCGLSELRTSAATDTRNLLLRPHLQETKFCPQVRLEASPFPLDTQGRPQSQPNHWSPESRIKGTAYVMP